MTMLSACSMPSEWEVNVRVTEQVACCSIHLQVFFLQTATLQVYCLPSKRVSVRSRTCRSSGDVRVSSLPVDARTPGPEASVCSCSSPGEVSSAVHDDEVLGSSESLEGPISRRPDGGRGFLEGRRLPGSVGAAACRCASRAGGRARRSAGIRTIPDPTPWRSAVVASGARTCRSW